MLVNVADDATMWLCAAPSLKYPAQTTTLRKLTYYEYESISLFFHSVSLVYHPLMSFFILRMKLTVFVISTDICCVTCWMFSFCFR